MKTSALYGTGCIALLYCCLAVSAGATPYGRSARGAWRTLTKDAQAPATIGLELKQALLSALPDLQSQTNVNELLALSDASADCTAATDSLFKTILGFNYSALTDDSAQSVFSASSCGVQLEDVWSYSEDDVPSQAKIGGWCNGCATRIRTALANAQTKCSSAADKTATRALFYYFEKIFARALNTPCLRIGGKFCMEAWIRADQALPKITTYTATTLAPVCSDCIRAFQLLVNEFQAYKRNRPESGLNELTSMRPLGPQLQDGPPPPPTPPGDGGGSGGGTSGTPMGDLTDLDIACFQVDGVFCLPKFIEVDNTTAASQASDLTRLCDPCFQRIIPKLRRDSQNEPYYSNAAKYVNVVPALCSKKEASSATNCASDVSSSITDVETMCKADLASDSATCGSSCNARLTELVTSVGCCSRGVIRYIGLRASPAWSSDTAFARIAANCSRGALPDVCTPAVIKNVSIDLGNIKRDFFDSNKTALLDALKKDIAASLGIPLDKLDVVDASAVGNSAPKVVVVLQGFDTPSVDALSTQLSDGLAGGSVSFSNTIGVTAAGEGSVDPNQPLGGGTANTFGSNAVATATSVVPLVIAAVLSVMLML